MALKNVGDRTATGIAYQYTIDNTNEQFKVPAGSVFLNLEDKQVAKSV